MKIISSTQNAYIKDLLKLQDKSRERKKKGLFLVEGQREISLVIKGGYQIDTILFVAELFSEENLQEIQQHTSHCIEITKSSLNFTISPISTSSKLPVISFLYLLIKGIVASSFNKEIVFFI